MFRTDRSYRRRSSLRFIDPHFACHNLAIIILESFSKPRPTTNPYLQELVKSFPDGVRAEYFSWKKALVGRYDVFHVHWPEILVRGSSPAKTAMRCVAFLVVLLRIKFTHVVIVRTVHNVEPHERPHWIQRGLLSLCDRWTTLYISLSDHVPTPSPSRTVIIPLGHFRDWYSDAVREGGVAEPVLGRLLNVGLVRPYKGIEGLLNAFRELEDPSVSLRIVGKFMDPDLGALIWQECESDERLSATDDYVDDVQMATEVTSAELVVLPFFKSTNSSSMILALSLDRPVLVPSSPTTEQIAQEVGPGWVQTFDGPLSSDRLLEALISVRGITEGAPPNLSAREWDPIGAMHEQAFARALATRTG